MRVTVFAMVLIPMLACGAQVGAASPGIPSEDVLSPSAAVPLLAAAVASAKSDAHVSGVNIPDGRAGGETIETAVVIPAIPFTDTGDTCPFADDYEEMCPYGSNSPDCVYSFAPEANMLIDINLCLSDYDTKVFVYENDVSGFVACNDDNFACDTPNFLYQSWLTDVQVYAGNIYYIVVDGYSGDCGEYVLDVHDSWDCIVDCPGDALLEGEVDCYDGYVDDYNGGCGSVPVVFTSVDCSNEPITICGTGGVYAMGGLLYRDTDWYMLTLDAPATVTVGVYAEFPPLVGLLDYTSGCAGVEFYDYATPWRCEYDEVTVTLPAGETPVFVATATWETGDECGSVYYITIDGYECTSPVEERSWGSIKSLYR